MATDEIVSVQEFYITDNFIPNFNSSVIVLIPKVIGANSMGNFWPISLANFRFKIVTKILSDRLSTIVMCISVQHKGFVKDRHIVDCLIIASEAINLVDKK